MGLGLLLLVSVGKENLYLSAQPEITFFKKAYKRHTNYSIEPTPQYFKTTPDFGRRCTVNVAKNADLIGMTYIYVELPYIQLENKTLIDKKFAWVNKIGLALINFVEIEIGGSIIERHYGDWLNIWNEITTSTGHKPGYNKMIGNISELTEYSQTKQSHILYIPLAFWFCQDVGLALPLIALIHNDVKIHVEFNDVDKCYKLSPSHYITLTDNFCLFNSGEIFYQNYQNSKNIGEFVSFDPITQKLYYNPLKGKFIVPVVSNDPELKLIGNTTNTSVNIKPNSIVVKDEDYFRYNKPSLINSYLLINYIYLDNFERLNFLHGTHEYLIPIVQNISEQVMYSTNVTYKLPFVNPIKLLIWRGVLVSNEILNDNFNYTTIPYTDTEENIVVKNTLVINSINRMEPNSIEYYTNLPKYQYKFKGQTKGIYYYSFALNPLDLQPSGSLNFSKTDDAYILFKLNKLINYQNPVTFRCYGIQYNILRTFNGIGGLQFTI
jgi:hypothetical protein